MTTLDAGGPAATGVGSLPGIDPLGTCTWVLETFAELPHLPELPGKGLGADAVGRTAGLLVDLPVEHVASGWQVAARPGADLQRARQLLAEDLAALEVAAHGWSGRLKLQVVGPLTLAAALGQARGEAAVSDPGLLRDISGSLAEGVRGHLAEVADRVPEATLVLQVDEPSLPAVLAGDLSSRSGWSRLPAVDAAAAQGMLAAVLDAAPEPRSAIVHSCAAAVPVPLVAAAGAGAVGFDLDLLREAELDAYAAALDDGLGLVVGAVPTSRGISGAEAADRTRALLARLGFDVPTVRDRLLVCPACGLAGLGADEARAAYRTAVEAAQRLSEDDEQ